MSSDERDPAPSRRKPRRIKRLEIDEEEEAEEQRYNVVASPRGVDNQAFQSDEGNRPTEGDEPPPIQDDTIPQRDVVIESQPGAKETVSRKHREKSRELDRKLPPADPNEVAREMDGVRSKIKDMMKNKLTQQLEAVRDGSQDGQKDDDPERKSSKPDLKLDLNASTTMHRSSNTARMEEILKRMKKQGDTTTSYRLTGTVQRDTSRFDRIEDTESEDKKKLEKLKQITAKRQFKMAGLSVIDQIHIPSAEEEYEFFCKEVWEKDADEELLKRAREKEIEEEKRQKAQEQRQKDRKEGDEGKKDGDEGKGEEVKPVEDSKETDALIIKMEEDWRDMSYIKAIYTPHRQLVDAEKKALFMPSTRKVPIEKKLGEEVKKGRDLALEGYYVGRKPFVTRKNRTLMENRLIKFPDKIGLKWFGVDGEILALPDPIKYISTRPAMDPTFYITIGCDYRKALFLPDFSKNLLAERGSLNTVNVAKYRIDLDLNQVQFEFHHLFSEEHIIAFNLRKMYQHHQLSNEQNLIEILASKLKAVREALLRFMEELKSNARVAAARHHALVESTGAIIPDKFNSGDSNTVILPNGMQLDYISTSDLVKLNSYKNEIKQTRRQLNIEMKKHKELTEKIVLTWKELKNKRAEQKFRSTEMKLIIKKKEVDRELEEREYQEDFNQEYDDILTEKKLNYDRKVAEYNTLMKAWNLQRTRKQEARKRVEEREKKKGQLNFNINFITQDKEAEENDLKILAEDDLIKPDEPKKLNAEKVRLKLADTYAKCRKAPGDPILFFDLIDEPSSITPSNECSLAEQTRRTKLSRTRMYAKIFSNGKLVYTTNKCQLQNDFTVSWGQIFNIYIINQPEAIIIQLMELIDSRINDHILSEIRIPAPEANTTSANYTIENYNFSAKQFSMQLNGNEKDKFVQYFTSGVLRAGAGWGIDEKSGEVLVPPDLVKKQHDAAVGNDERKGYDAIAAIGVSRMQNMEKLAEWFTKSNLDPNDPRNADLIDLIRTLSNINTFETGPNGFKLSDHFRLDQMIEEFNFANEQDIESDKRFRLISLRANDEPEFRGLKMLPLNSKYIKEEVFEPYRRRVEGVGNELGFGDQTMADSTMKSTRVGGEPQNEIELSRWRGQKIVSKIREKIIKQFKFSQSQKHLSDMVIEEQVPNIK